MERAGCGGQLGCYKSDPGNDGGGVGLSGSNLDVKEKIMEYMVEVKTWDRFDVGRTFDVGRREQWVELWHLKDISPWNLRM